MVVNLTHNLDQQHNVENLNHYSAEILQISQYLWKIKNIPKANWYFQLKLYKILLSNLG